MELDGWRPGPRSRACGSALLRSFGHRHAVKSHVDSVAEALVKTPPESLRALCYDCPAKLQSDLVELAGAAGPVANISDAATLKQRGFAVSARGGLRSSCRLMKRYAAGRKEGVTSLRRLFGDAGGFEGNIRGVLELRLEQVAGADPELLGYVRNAVRDLTGPGRSSPSRSGQCHGFGSVGPRCGPPASAVETAFPLA